MRNEGRERQGTIFSEREQANLIIHVEHGSTGRKEVGRIVIPLSSLGFLYSWCSQQEGGIHRLGELAQLSMQRRFSVKVKSHRKLGPDHQIRLGLRDTTLSEGGVAEKCIGVMHALPALGRGDFALDERKPYSWSCWEGNRFREAERSIARVPLRHSERGRPALTTADRAVAEC